MCAYQLFFFVLYLAVDFHALDDINSPFSNAYLNIKDSLRDLFLILFPQLDFLVKHISSKRARLTRDVDALSNLLLDVAKKRRQEIQERRAQGIVVPDNQKDLLTRIMEAELDGIDGMSSDEDLRVSVINIDIEWLYRFNKLYTFRVTWQFSSWLVRIQKIRFF